MFANWETSPVTVTKFDRISLSPLSLLFLSLLSFSLLLVILPWPRVATAPFSATFSSLAPASSPGFSALFSAETSNDVLVQWSVSHASSSLLPHQTPIVLPFFSSLFRLFVPFSLSLSLPPPSSRPFQRKFLPINLRRAEIKRIGHVASHANVIASSRLSVNFSLNWTASDLELNAAKLANSQIALPLGLSQPAYVLSILAEARTRINWNNARARLESQSE